MLKDITLGQYFPGNSVIHRMDPRVKLILTVLYIVIIFLADNVYCYGALMLSALLLVLFSHISLRVVLKGLKPILFVLIFTTVIHIFFTDGERLLVSFLGIEIYLEGILRAVFMGVRVIVLVIGTSVLLTYTTSPIVLTDAIESLLSPLKKIRVPVHDFAMMLTIALRFIPTLIEETDKIMNAQKARGAAFDSGNVIARVRALVPVIIPLLVSSFGRADELATAMECRCYRGDVGRTRYVRMKAKASDFFILLLFVAFGAAIVLADLYLSFGFTV